MPVKILLQQTLFEMLEKTSPGYGTVQTRNISDADMLQMEQTNQELLKTKDNRQLNAKGGLANLLGE